jgi:uncharacterized damage-inducible protein DinB
MSDHLTRLFEHNRWADERVIGAMRGAAALGKPVPRAVALLAHVIGAEAVWLARLEQRPVEVAVWPTLTVDECESLARRTHAGFLTLAALDDAAAERQVHYRNSAGAEFDSRISDVLLHVALHGSYHRGQVALLLRDAGAEPAPTDYIAFARGAAAAVRQ